MINTGARCYLCGDFARSEKAKKNFECLKCRGKNKSGTVTRAYQRLRKREFECGWEKDFDSKNKLEVGLE